jgi:hypothetical protein
MKVVTVRGRERRRQLAVVHDFEYCNFAENMMRRKSHL